jgi:hypothetical protein
MLSHMVLMLFIEVCVVRSVSKLSILISLLVFPYIWVRTNYDMRFINLTHKITRWTCSYVKECNEPSKPMRIKKIHSHLIKKQIEQDKRL